MTGEYNSVVLSMFYMRNKNSVLDRYHIKEHLVNIKRCSYVVFMLGHRLRRWPNIKTTQLHPLVPTGCFIGLRGGDYSARVYTGTSMVILLSNVETKM